MIVAVVLAILGTRPTWCSSDDYVACEDRIAALAAHMNRAAATHGLDTELLAAVAWIETRWNPWAVGPRGSRGIMQVHPVHGCPAPFLCSAGMRRWCRSEADACQGPVIDFAASRLARWRERCGSQLRALGYYNSGRCRVTRFGRSVQRVLSEWREQNAVDTRI